MARSDHGSRFISRERRTFLRQHKLEPSMSRRGSFRDNALGDGPARSEVPRGRFCSSKSSCSQPETQAQEQRHAVALRIRNQAAETDPGRCPGNQGHLTSILAATGLRPCEVRGAILGVLKSRLGLSVTWEKFDGRGRVCRLDAV
ncbi:MAG: DUF3489 domain-containing protein [Pseudooceanicola sp.]|nr:DUF3489 domain-containing protein [Pseudooceanicola sp.]